MSGSVEGPLHHKSGCVCLGRDAGLAGPRPGTRGQTRPIGRVQHGFFFFVFFFILAATGDVEEDGGLSDSVPTSKRIPVVCLWSFAPPSSPPTVTSLGVPVSSEVAPDTICWQPVARGWGVLI